MVVNKCWWTCELWIIHSHVLIYQLYQYSQMDVWCLHSSTQINTSVKADRFLWLQREEWLHKPGLRWNLPGAVTPFIQKAQLRRFDVFFPSFPALLFSPNIETTSPRHKLLPNAVTLARWLWWCLSHGFFDVFCAWGLPPLRCKD